MMTVMRILAVALVVAPVFANDPPEFALWKSVELDAREEALSKNVGQDHSARETLGAYGNHRLRMLYRDADGNPEQHDREVDVVIVHGGEGTLVVGGTMVGARAGSGPGEHVGTSIEGGERHALGPGDLVHIPPKVPHRFLVPEGKHITYVIVKVLQSGS
jgi:mannose-6-phosphate isomerase-like protein (cupin superfamily)